MLANTWNVARATARISGAIKAVETVEVQPYARDMSLESIPTNRAYLVHAAHLYVDVVNVDELLAATAVEGTSVHQRVLRFLNQHYRAVHRILGETDVKRVDFHNQRLHAIVAKPYGEKEEAARIHKAIAVAQLITDVLRMTGDDDEHIPNASIRVGIDSGRALAVNNGRRGGREPLFLGAPANFAAKLSGRSASPGIFLTNNARQAIGLKPAADAGTTPLSAAEISKSQEQAGLVVTCEQVVRQWRDDMKANPIGTFEFSGHTPPLSSLDISQLTPANSRRQEVASIYADLDGFTAFVDAHIDDNPEDVVRTLHVLRSEMDQVLSADFGGRRIRFIGDCIHGLIAEGTAQTTDAVKTLSTATLCAGALRSSFELAQRKLTSAGVTTGRLGLQIGFEYGPVATTRLGMQGSRVRCSVGRAVRGSEREQLRCSAEETAIGPTAYAVAGQSVRRVFGTTRKLARLDYNEAVESMAADDEVAKSAKAEAFEVASPAIIRSTRADVKPHAE